MIAMPVDSSIGAASLAQILACVVDEPIEVAGLNLGFKLPIPVLGVKLSKPGSKRCSLFVGKPPHGFFDLFNRTHDRD